MKGVILSAGKGTRMKELTGDTPKPLLKICNKTLLEIVIDGLKRCGVDEFFMVTGYLAEKIEKYLGNGSKYGVLIHFIRQEKQDGTGDALKICKEFVGDSQFFMTFADIIVHYENYIEMKRTFESEKCDVLLAVNWVNDPSQGAAVYLKEESNIKTKKVKQIVEKPKVNVSTTNWNNSGIYIFPPLIFEYVNKIAPSPRGEYELTTAIDDMIKDGKNVRAFEIKGYWSDVGTPDDLKKINDLFYSKNI